MKFRSFVELTALDMVDMFQMSFLGVIITSIIFYLYKTVMRNKINSYFDKEDIHTLIIIIIIKIFISLLIIMFIKKIIILVPVFTNVINSSHKSYREKSNERTGIMFDVCIAYVVLELFHGLSDDLSALNSIITENNS
uniref:Uncharacterized protein n=1 Tax=Florenciella sp. virus SA2 TaxID=3240092 RepID=A0AB39JFY4_9VIRU